MNLILIIMGATKFLIECHTIEFEFIAFIIQKSSGHIKKRQPQGPQPVNCACDFRCTIPKKLRLRNQCVRRIAGDYLKKLTLAVVLMLNAYPSSQKSFMRFSANDKNQILISLSEQKVCNCSQSILHVLSCLYCFWKNSCFIHV